jgi:hypothetical protein
MAWDPTKPTEAWEPEETAEASLVASAMAPGPDVTKTNYNNSLMLPIVVSAFWYGSVTTDAGRREAIQGGDLIINSHETKQEQRLDKRNKTTSMQTRE